MSIILIDTLCDAGGDSGSETVVEQHVVLLPRNRRQQESVSGRRRFSVR